MQKVERLDWRRLTGKAKYKAYLASREWGKRKEAVHARAQGVCERCRRNPIDAVHHMTYERIFNERLTDLLGICDSCHSFEHGKSDHDPAENKTLIYKGKEIGSVYLAGKISGEKGDWRDQLFVANHEALSGVHWSFNMHADAEKGWKPRPCARWIGGFVADFAGPFWQETGEDHCGWSGVESNPCHTYPHDFQASIRYATLTAIGQHADLVFAWIDSDDCYGTLAEIGFAIALRKPVVIAVHPETPRLGDMWYPLLGHIVANSPEEAWRKVFVQ